MSSVILVIHLIVAVVLIVLILLQRSEGGGLGIGGAGDFMSGRAAGNILSRLTGIFALVFFVTSLSLALLSSINQKSGIIDGVKTEEIQTLFDEQEGDENSLPDLK